jgi:hypothetical protein
MSFFVVPGQEKTGPLPLAPQIGLAAGWKPTDSSLDTPACELSADDLFLVGQAR